MATNIDTGLTAAAADPQVFTMSDDSLVVLYFNGTAWGYRIKPLAGSWGSRTALSSSPTGTAAFAQAGDTIYGFAGTTLIFYKLVYASGGITVTSAVTGDSGSPVVGVYLDTTLSRVVGITMLPSAGIYLYSAAMSNLAMFFEQISASPTSGATEDTYATAGDGGSTFYVAFFDTTSSSTFRVYRIVSGADATGTTETAETGMSNLAAACKGLIAIYDGTDIVFVANENNGAIRTCKRTGTNTYTSWTTLVTAGVSGQPQIAQKASTHDLMAAYIRTASQANGEVYKLARRSGTWDSVGTSVAGGASTGWQEVGCAPSDLNQDTAGVIPLVYVTGTASTWTLVEDSTNVGLPPQQIRPDADTVTTGWTTTPLWSKVDEAVAGGDVITATAA